MKIPTNVAVCTSDGEPLSTNGEDVKCRRGCLSNIPEWNRKVVRFAKEAKRYLKQNTPSEDRREV